MGELLYYGKVHLCLKEVMDKKNISIYELSKMTNLKYDTVKKYYENEVYRYDEITLAKMCYSLNCTITDLLVYECNIEKDVI